jgi:hypothetical protein
MSSRCQATSAPPARSFCSTQQQVGFEHQGAGEPEALAHAAGEHRRRAATAPPTGSSG